MLEQIFAIPPSSPPLNLLVKEELGSIDLYTRHIKLQDKTHVLCHSVPKEIQISLNRIDFFRENQINEDALT